MGKRWSRQNTKRPCMTLVVAGMIAMVGGPGVGYPQATGFAVTPLLRTPLSADKSQEVLIATGQFEPAGTTGRHSHHGDEYATVIEGTVEVVTDGQPPRRYTAGEAYHNARGVVHETRNVGKARARVVSTLIVDSGRPIIEPAD